MSTVPDKRLLRMQLPGEGTDPVGPSSVGSAPAGRPPVAWGTPVEASEAHGKALPAIEPMSVGLQLLEAMKPFLPTPAAPGGPVAVVAAFPESHALPALHLQMKAVLEAIEHATTEKEVMASLETFLTTETAIPPDTDTLAVLTTLFGAECVADVFEVGAAAVADLEAEAASTGGAISERAASRIARSMVHRVTSRADRTMARPPRAQPALRVRFLRAPRARRAPRRAVRLSAVASAGSGGEEPSPEPPGAPDRVRLPAGRQPSSAPRDGREFRAPARKVPGRPVAQFRAAESCVVRLCDARDGRYSPVLVVLDEVPRRPEATP